MLVVGGKEVETGTVSYRDRIDGDQGALPLDEAVRPAPRPRPRPGPSARSRAPPTPVADLEESSPRETRLLTGTAIGVIL